MRRLILGACMLLAACLGDPAGPSGAIQLLVNAPVGPDSVLHAGPGETVGPISIRVLDGRGRAIPGAQVSWLADTVSGFPITPAATTDADGQARTMWRLGTRAPSRQTLDIKVRTVQGPLDRSLQAVATPHVVQALTFSDTVLSLKVSDSLRAPITAHDPFGNLFAPDSVQLVSSDTSRIVVRSGWLVGGRTRGIATIHATASGVSASAKTSTIQVVDRITLSPDSVAMTSLGDTVSVEATVWDDHGILVSDTTAPAIVTGQAAIWDSVRESVVSRANGVASIAFSIGPVTARLPVVVQQRPHALRLTVDDTAYAAVGDTATANVTVVDSLGSPLTQPSVLYSSRDTNVLAVSASKLTTRGNGRAWIVASAGSGIADSTAISVRQIATSMTLDPPSGVTFGAINDSVGLQVRGFDHNGNAVAGSTITYQSSAPSVVSVALNGVIRALTNGSSTITATMDSSHQALPVNVAQRAARIVSTPTQLTFGSLGSTQSLQLMAVDSGGTPLAQQGTILPGSILDTAVARLTAPASVQAVANGTSVYNFSLNGVPSSVVIVVRQVGTVLQVSGIGADTILRPSLGDSLAFKCISVDSNGHLLPPALITANAVNGTLAGGSCASLRAVHSGVDTVVFATGAVTQRVPMRSALVPSVSSKMGQFVSISGGNLGDPWAPSADLAPDGTLELYIANYVLDTSMARNRSSLIRLTSQDGLNFSWDTTMVSYGPDDYTGDGRGIENTVIFPNASGSGWRMLYSGGGDSTGWQVYGAVSNDRRHWTKTGVVIGNGYPGTLRPSGEGMQVYQDAAGEWHLIMGAYPGASSTLAKWAITEWRSIDQVTWSYDTTWINPNALPPGAERAAYSPSIRQIGPSMWRALFTADQLNGAPNNSLVNNGQSGIWSAVSSDMVNWTVEGLLVGSTTTNIYYTALAGNQLYFIRTDLGKSNRLATVQVSMP